MFLLNKGFTVIFSREDLIPRIKDLPINDINLNDFNFIHRNIIQSSDKIIIRDGEIYRTLKDRLDNHWWDDYPNFANIITKS